jgi:hypothetical protein
MADLRLTDARTWLKGVLSSGAPRDASRSDVPPKGRARNPEP